MEQISAQLEPPAAEQPHAPGVLLGEGSSAAVYQVSGTEVVKLFKPGAAASMVEREFEAARLAAQHGLQVGAPLARSTQRGHEAIHYRFVPGPSLLSVLSRAPRLALPTMVRLARLHASIHRHDVAGRLRSQREVLATDIHQGPAAAQDKADTLRLLGALPVGTRLCHGDFHPGNVIDSPEGLAVIDWAKASAGHPAADVARTELLLRFAPVDGALTHVAFVRLGRWLAAAVYVRCYLACTGMRRAEVLAWQLPTALAWLRSRPGRPGDEFERYLARLLARQPAR